MLGGLVTVVSIASLSQLHHEDICHRFCHIRLPNVEGIRNSTMKEKPLINTFAVDEIRKLCLTQASEVYQKQYPISESLWRLPDDIAG
ncbi:hypothetical protein SADUNF_Sadunf05G0016300 [Salix dunnii]|uniref:Uncharacterized protein n=1 Tax=Salix dunnii TaxID=1413687 RepID=A0A835K395_9ROSI|nr:hypothetical protein SADUNF_Sadunf05G0016300 [Salix dunnii]